jgi:hypothetical protein
VRARHRASGRRRAVVRRRDEKASRRRTVSAARGVFYVLEYLLFIGAVRRLRVIVYAM